MADVNELKLALGEIYSQCWESEEFKKNFMENPKKVLDEYGVPYDDAKEYRILEAPAKTMLYVLPYEGVKEAMKAISEGFMTNVKDVEDGEAKQIIPEGWSLQFVQNTEDVSYIVIPNSPENMTPEELEMINGGCGFLGIVLTTGFIVAAGVIFMTGAAIISAAAVVAAVETVGGIHCVLG